jgi:hypothetical protein
MVQSCFRFCFLPENSTHILQPLDVSVFGPLKRRWREVLENWKEECTAGNLNYPTLPKQVPVPSTPPPDCGIGVGTGSTFIKYGT